MQCRVTTEDPEKDFTPDYGKILSYRSAAGFGVRLDGAMGDTGSIITPFYDSLLVKLTLRVPISSGIGPNAQSVEGNENQGVKTNIRFLKT